MDRPQSRPRAGLVWRLLGAFAVVVLVSLTTVSILANRTTAFELRAFMLRGGMSTESQLADELAAYYRGRVGWGGVESLFMGPGPGAHMGGMTGMGGQGPMMSGAVLLADDNGQVIAGRGGQPRELSTTELEQSTAIVVDGRVVGHLIVEGPRLAESGEDLIARVNRALWLAAAAGGLVALVLGAGLVVSLLRPVRELTLAAQSVAGGELSRRVTVRSTDEIGQLSLAFNRMAENLQIAEDLRREMTADIAHELRNPLAVMQARLEGLADGVYSLTPESLAPVLEQSQLLNRLVEDLRTLALVDAGRLPLVQQEVDLRQLVDRTLAGYRAQAEANRVILQLGERSSLQLLIQADAARIQQVLGNLLGNALRHTPAGGEILVTVRESEAGNHAEVLVTDSGEGIPEEALPHLFERFYRGSRGLDRKSGGTGLGLAIARQIVEAHGGSLEARNRPEGGAEFAISFPI